jgi:tetratricopeptide (TPR) repeat protein
MNDGTPNELKAAADLRRAGRLNEAERIYLDLLAGNPNNPDAHYELGTLLQVQSRHGQAAKALDKATTLQPNNPWAHAALATSLKALGRLDEAIAEYETTIVIDAGIANVHNNLGNLYKMVMRHEDAVRCFRRAIELDHSHASAFQNLGGALVEMGRADEAIDAFRQAIRLKPHYARAHHHLAMVKKHERVDEEVEVMESLWARADLAAAERTHLGFGLGKAFDDLGQFPAAFRYYAEANRIKHQLENVPLQNSLNDMQAMRSLFINFPSSDAVTTHGPTPIFVLGMPRSGTSLTEQLLANHSRVSGAGELPTIGNLIQRSVENYPSELQQLSDQDWRELGRNYIEHIGSISGGADFVVDKMPGNFLFIGAIRKMLPNAIIVHCRRDPRDTCLSCFKAYFLDQRLSWTGDLQELGIYYRHYQELMDHWQAVLPDLIFDAHYEDLVTNTEAAARRLLDACDLPHEAACLQYKGSQRTVATASAIQVRQAIHSKSINTWKNYEAELKALCEELDRR